MSLRTLEISEHISAMKLHIRYINECISEIENEVFVDNYDFTPTCLERIKERAIQIRFEVLEIKIATQYPS